MSLLSPKTAFRISTGTPGQKSWCTALLAIGSFQVSIFPEHVSQFRTPFLPLGFPPTFSCLPGGLQCSLLSASGSSTCDSLCSEELWPRNVGRGHHFQLLHPFALYPILAPSLFCPLTRYALFCRDANLSQL